MRLRRRARELGLSDAEVARRVGIAATRFGNYAGDRHEPDLATFARICRVLGASPAAMLGMDPEPGAPSAALSDRVIASVPALGEEDLLVLAIVAEALVSRAGRHGFLGTGLIPGGATSPARSAAPGAGDRTNDGRPARPKNRR